MARTPLLRALRQLAGEHAAAEKLGIPVEEVRARREEQAYSRKDFLKRTGAVGAALAAAGPAGALVRTARGATAPRIAIVGGGIAGLTTALTLQDRGVASTVYEAHPSRIGGRMHSDFVDFPGYWVNGQGAELCGELIDTGHKTILALARRFNLATVDLLGAEPNGSTDTYRFFGDYYPADEADRDFKAIRAALHRDLSVAGYPTTYKISTAEGIPLDNMSIYEWIESRVPGGHSSPFGQLLDVAYNIEYGAETTEQSALNVIYLLGYSGAALSLYGASDERFHIVGGNTLLPLAIRDSIVQAQGASAVRMGWRLSSVKANADGTVALGFDSPDGKQTVTADHVVLCMSFPVLRTLDTGDSSIIFASFP